MKGVVLSNIFVFYLCHEGRTQLEGILRVWWYHESIGLETVLDPHLDCLLFAVTPVPVVS